MKKIAVALSLSLFAVGLSCGRGAGAVAAEGGAWAIVNPKGDYVAQIQNQKIILDLLRNGVTVYWYAGGQGGAKSLNPGDYVVLGSGEYTSYIKALLKELPGDRQVDATGALGGKGYKLRWPRIAAPPACASALQRSGFAFSLLHTKEKINQLDGTGVFCFSWTRHSDPRPSGQAIRDHIKRGGAYVGLTEADLVEAEVSFDLDGQGSLIVKNEAPDHPVMWHLPEEFSQYHRGGSVLEAAGASAVSLASVKTAELKRSKKAAEAPGKTLWAAGQRPGEGRAVVFASWPSVAMLKNGKREKTNYMVGPVATNRLLSNAIFWSTAGDPEAIKAPAGKPERPAGWFEPTDAKVVDRSALFSQALKQTVEAIKTVRALPPKDSYKEVALPYFLTAFGAMSEMGMAKGGDKAGWFDKRREELLAQLKELSATAAAAKEVPSELAAQCEAWARDYQLFLEANGRIPKGKVAAEGDEK